MKKLLLSIVFLGACSTTFAQFKGAPTITFGVQGGVNIANMSIKYSDPSQAQGISLSSITGFHIGGLADFSFGTFSIQPGLFYSAKGVERTFSGTIQKITLNYLEVPVNFLYKIPVGNGKVFLGAGPYLGYGFSGKDKVTYNTPQLHFTRTDNIVWGAATGSGGFKRADLGLNFAAGYQLNQGLMFKLGYGLGLTNIVNLSDQTYKNGVTSISVGYFFK